MLAIRLQRIGRKNNAHYRVIVQDSRNHPKRGKIVENVGTYDPHLKLANINKETIQKYINNGAQPSNRVAILLKKEGLKLPKWVTVAKQPKRDIKNIDKLRKNRPAGSPEPEKTPKPEETKQEDKAGAEPSEDNKNEKPKPADDKVKDETEEKPDQSKKEDDSAKDNEDAKSS